jgi:hypothetical protein
VGLTTVFDCDVEVRQAAWIGSRTSGGSLQNQKFRPSTPGDVV